MEKIVEAQLREEYKMDILYEPIKSEITLPKIIEVKIKRLFWFGYKTELD